MAILSLRPRDIPIACVDACEVDTITIMVSGWTVREPPGDQHSRGGRLLTTSNVSDSRHEEVSDISSIILTMTYIISQWTS